MSSYPLQTHRPITALSILRGEKNIIMTIVKLVVIIPYERLYYGTLKPDIQPTRLA